MAQAGQRISEYVLETPIGGGAFGQVWKARHHVWNDQVVAIKLPSDPQYVRNLQREGKAIHGLNHPNIVRAMGFDPYADPPYLVMEYVPGTSLRPLIQQKKLSIDDSVAVMRQMLSGVAYAHSQGLIHRDLKPENILIHERALSEGFKTPGVAKVTDFGLGSAATSAAVGSIAYSASMNDPAGKEIAGTLDYMAPESRQGDAKIDGRADLYACGVMLYEMLTGERPAGTDLPSDLNKVVPKVLDDAFKRSYSRLEKRFATADEFIEAIGSKPPPLPSVIPAVIKRAGATACPGCQKPVDAKDQFCMHCGRQLVPQVRRCPKCGAYPDSTDRFCMFCGQHFGAELAVG